ncbi:MAG: L-serine ammonia-lyase, iron-sulfur-dependent, subunit alpha [Campylobacterales bacterium]|nr:L-serine ammonia-lyase, iron-sulfur-dependent, subunit alpha [Campylobacterales bacterium]
MKNEQILNLLREEIVPAQGCTEPIAIAYVSAKARETLGLLPNKVNIYISGNMIKNVKSVIIPNSEAMVGIEAAVALGLCAGDSKKELMVISELTKDDIKKAKDYLKSNVIHVIHDKTTVKLYIKIEMFHGDNSSLVEIKHYHTNITRIEKNSKILLDQICNDIDFKSKEEDRSILNIKSIYNFAKTCDIKDVEYLFNQVIALNSKIARAGLNEEFGVNIGSLIQKNMNEGFYGKDIRNKCVSFAAAGSDARMSGCSLPVMTTSGSGNQGMTASLPIIKYCNEKNLSKEELIRGLLFSHLATIHLKTNIGRLSAYCGVMCAASAVAGAITFLENADYDTVANAITNNLGNVSGIICDGAKASCATKVATGLYAAFDSSMLALNHKYLQGGDGIISTNVEDTIKNIGVLAQSGMKKTDEVILSIMQDKTQK